MAALQKEKLRGAAPKVRNRNRGKWYWVQLSRGRSNRAGRIIVFRDVRNSVNYPKATDVGSAAYRRLLAKKSGRK